MPNLDAFIKYLSQEQNKLISMGKIKGSKAHALVLHDGGDNLKHIYKSKDKGNAHENPKKEGNTIPFNDSYGSKGEK